MKETILPLHITGEARALAADAIPEASVGEIEQRLAQDGVHIVIGYRSDMYAEKLRLYYTEQRGCTAIICSLKPGEHADEIFARDAMAAGTVIYALNLVTMAHFWQAVTRSALLSISIDGTHGVMIAADAMWQMDLTQ
jgi:hypothetical protein